jgi:transcriptional regulator with XRE-family HTH domain
VRNPTLISEKIAKLLRSSRMTLGHTQKELAHRAGVSNRLWAEVERGERPNVSLETALRMLKAVGVAIQFTDPAGDARDIGVRDDAAAMSVRAAARRATWKGKQTRLSADDGADGAPADRRSRLYAVAAISNQVFAVSEGRPSSAAKRKRA